MWSAVKPLAWILLGIMLREVLSPVLGPVLQPALPTMGGLIQSVMASQSEAAITTAIRYAAAGYREPGDVVLTLMGLLIVFGMVAIGVVVLRRLPRPIGSARRQYGISALLVLVMLGVAYLVYILTGEFTARANAMDVYKNYQRKMAVVAPYLSPQEAREIHSQWARMNGKADLEAIDERLLALIRQHGLASDSPPAAKPVD